MNWNLVKRTLLQNLRTRQPSKVVDKPQRKLVTDHNYSLASPKYRLRDNKLLLTKKLFFLVTRLMQKSEYFHQNSLQVA